jgi:hypothetical protein
MTKRRKSVLAVLALAAAAVFALPASSASAASATTSNACANSVTANFSQIDVTTSGDDGLTTVAPGGTTTTSGLSQSAAIPGDIFVAGYNLGLLVVGTNNIPANVRSTIEATNTVEGQQNTNTVGGTPPDGTVSVSTTITDPDGTPGTGDETATPASFTVNYNNLTWTAGASGTIDYRQQSIATAPPTAANNTLLINALVGGVFNVQFRCAPGTVTGPDPGVITLIDPAGSFDTTLIQAAPVDTPPTANAGPDQTVTENTLVTLAGSGTDPEGETLTFNWTAPAGITLSDPTSATPTFTAPDVAAPTPFTLTLEVCDEADPTALCDTDEVVVTVNPEGVEEIDAAGEIKLRGPVQAKKDSKKFSFRVTNLGDSPITVDPDADIDAFVEVNGTPNGSVTALSGTKTIEPGHRAKFRFRWDGDIDKGDTVEFTACVNLAGDVDTSNDCDSATATATK